MNKKQFVVIGLGRFGSSIAKTLYSLGHDVLAIDSDEDIIQDISDSVTHAVQMDAADEGALRGIGIRNFDVAVVTIGENVQSSVMITLTLKEMGVKYIIAKAHNELHSKVLNKVGADRVILPEKDMGVRVAHNLVSTNILDYIELSPDYSIVEIISPEDWHYRSLNDINVRANYGINVMAIKRNKEINITPRADDIIEPGDVIVTIGGNEELNKLEGKISR